MRLTLTFLAPAALMTASCAAVCSGYCSGGLPASGRYNVCAAGSDSHLETDDKVVIGPIGVVTDVTLAAGASGGREIRLRALQGVRSLVAVHEPERRSKADVVVDHVVSIATASAPPECKKGTPVIRIEFLWKQKDDVYRSTSSSPHGGHAHAEQEV
jgi:hypothetical protein